MFDVDELNAAHKSLRQVLDLFDCSDIIRLSSAVENGEISGNSARWCVLGHLLGSCATVFALDRFRTSLGRNPGDHLPIETFVAYVEIGDRPSTCYALAALAAWIDEYLNERFPS